MMKPILVSAANPRYFPLVQGLFESYLAQPLSGVQLGMIGQDLDAQQLVWLAERGIQYQPLRHRLKAGIEPRRAYCLSPLQYAKAFLPDYFPDYEVILWLDADTWIQDIRVVSLYLRLAQKSELVITPEIHRAYMSHNDTEFLDALIRVNQAFHGKSAAERLMSLPFLNTGAFALQRQSKLWGYWQALLKHYVQYSQHTHLEQMALNYLVYTQQVPTPAILPSYCNYICYLALPVYSPETGLFYEPPNAPWQKIWLMHLTFPEKTRAYRLKTPEGHQLEQVLTYRPLKVLARQSDIRPGDGNGEQDQ